jgi:hypothetical protein
MQYVACTGKMKKKMHAKFKRKTSFKNGHLRDLDVDGLVLEREDVEIRLN